MKALGILLLAVLVGTLGYTVAYPKIFDPSFFPKDRTQFTETKTAQPEAPKVAAVTPKEEPKPEPKPEPEMKPEPKPEPKPELPAVAAAPGMGEATKKEDDPNEFHPPVFPALDDVVKGWKEIPKKAFPRPVKLLKAVEFVMPIGKSKVGPGGMATAVDQDGDKLIVAPTETSPARSQVSIDDTDLKQTLSQAYETWKVEMVAYKRRQFEFRKNAAARASEAPANPKDKKAAVAANDKPERGGDGTYPLLLASMKAGQVTEITPTNIKKWGEATQEKIDGKNYWCVIVNYTTKTMFGDFDTEAQARVMNGKVEKWVYTGSGEVVP